MTYTIDPGKKIRTTQVYYEDQVYETMDWTTLPDDGVLYVVILRMDGSQRSLHQKDYYFQAIGANDWVFGDSNNLEEIKRYKNPVILRGKSTDDATFEAVRRRAMQ